MNQTESILITGDFCPVNRSGEIIGTTRENNLLNDFISFVRKAGLAVTNLECPLTDQENGIRKVGPLLRAPTSVAKTLAGWGFNLVTLANNHIMDFKSQGLEHTIRACKESGIDQVGAGNNIAEARKVYFTNVGVHRVAVLNFAENEFSTTHGNSAGANPLDLVKNYHDIVKAKIAADFVLVIVHGGNEMYNLPSPRTRDTLRFYTEAGANAVIQHHSHCYSGYELYNGVPVFYGLGNFLFDKPQISNSPWNFGYAVELSLDPKLSFRLIPYEQCNGHVGLRLLHGREERGFFQHINQLNDKIANDEILTEEFDKYCTRVKRMYDSFLEPHSFRLIHFLRDRKILAPLLSRRKKTLYLNLFRCESHREVIVNLLTQQFR